MNYYSYSPSIILRQVVEKYTLPGTSSLRSCLRFGKRLFGAVAR